MTGPRLWVPAPAGPSGFVLHTSVALLWLLHRRGTTYTSDVLQKVSSTIAVVPATWGIQMADLVRRQELAGAVTRAEVERFYAGLRVFWIRIDDETNARAWAETHDLARTYRVSVPDAAYLELALRLQLPLATTDAALLRHAAAAGVPLYTP